MLLLWSQSDFDWHPKRWNKWNRFKWLFSRATPIYYLRIFFKFKWDESASSLAHNIKINKWMEAGGVGKFPEPSDKIGF